MKKKLFLLLPAFFLALSLGACNGKKQEEQKSGDEDSSSQVTPSGDQSGSGSQGGSGSGDQGGESGDQGGESGDQGGESGDQGGESGDQGGDEDPTVLNLTITGYPADKSAEHYGVHAWGGEEAGLGTRYDATLSGSTLTASVPLDIEGFLVVAYNGEFDWDNLVFKSDDFVIIEGRTTYALSDEGGEATTMNLTITAFPADKVAEHYAVHAWGGAAAAQNYEAELQGTTLTATVPADITGFLVTSFNGEFNWDSLVFKSGDFTVVPGQTEYEIPDPSAKLSITVTDLNENYANTEFDVYAYAWGGASTQDFLPVTRDGTSASFEVASTATGCLLLRVAKDATPSWDAKLDQTNDINLVAGTTSYTFPGVK